MDFGLSEEQVMLQDSLRRLLSERAGTDWLRDTLAQGAVHDATLWQSLAEMGLTALLVPEEYGGLGLGMLDAALVQEALGAFAAPVAFTETAILAPLAISLAGTAAQKEQWLPAIAQGTLQVAIGLGGAAGSRDGASVSAVDSKLSGRLLFVMGAPDASLLICSSDLGHLYALERNAPGIEWQALRSVDDSRCLWEVNLKDTPAQLLPEGNKKGDENTLASLHAAGRIALASDTLGAGQNMLERAVAYAAERKQFNRAIGSFQAVKHMCAEMAAELEPSRSLLWYSAHAFNHVPEERVLMACHVKAHLAEVGTRVARTATEVHGGMGFTDLLGLHYWFKRIGFNRQVLGSPERLREEAAQVQGWI